MTTDNAGRPSFHDLIARTVNMVDSPVVPVRSRWNRSEAGQVPGLDGAWPRRMPATRCGVRMLRHSRQCRSKGLPPPRFGDPIAPVVPVRDFAVAAESVQAVSPPGEVVAKRVCPALAEQSPAGLLPARPDARGSRRGLQCCRAMTGLVSSRSARGTPRSRLGDPEDLRSGMRPRPPADSGEGPEPSCTAVPRPGRYGPEATCRMAGNTRCCPGSHSVIRIPEGWALRMSSTGEFQLARFRCPVSTFRRLRGLEPDPLRSGGEPTARLEGSAHDDPIPSSRMSGDRLGRVLRATPGHGGHRPGIRGLGRP